jgi:hypothetical protein
VPPRLFASFAIASASLALSCGGRYERNPLRGDGVSDTAGTASSGSGGGLSTGGVLSTVAGGGATGGGATGGGATGGGATGGGATGGGPAEDPCAHQVHEYRQLWSELMTEFASIGCATADDCRSYYYQSACDPSCLLLTSAAHRGIIDQLNAFQLSSCDASCWPQPWPTCPAVAPVRCVSGRCQ